MAQENFIQPVMPSLGIENELSRFHQRHPTMYLQ